MNISELLAPERIACDASANSKKRVLEQLSTLVASSSPDLSAERIFDSLIGRERLGSTGLGNGVAIPHARLPGREAVIAAFIKLDAGIDFDAIDNKPVDLLFALLVPDHFTDEHLQILAHLAKLFSNKKLCERLRKSHTAEQLYEILTSPEANSSAA